MAAPDNTPPCSSRRTRDCTAGACEMSANNLSTVPDATEDGLAADAVAFCAKRKQIRSRRRKRQAGGDHLGGLISAEERQPLVRSRCMASAGLVKWVGLIVPEARRRG